MAYNDFNDFNEPPPEDELYQKTALPRLPQQQPQLGAPSAGTAPLPASPASTYNREALSQGLQGLQFSGNSQFNAGDWIGQHQGDFAQGVQMVGADKIRLPDGEIVDISRDVGAGGQGGAWWGSEKDWQAANARGAYGAPGQGGGGGGQAFGAPGGAGGPSGGVDEAMRAALLRLMGRSEPGAIDVNSDPNLSPQARAYAAARQRSAAQEREQTAERAAFQGLNSGGQGSGAFDTSLAGIQENAGRDIAGNEAGLVGQEVAARRNDLQQALQLANAIGARDQASQLQQQLAQLDTTYRYAALNQQNSQFGDTYGLDRAKYESETNRNALLDAWGR